MWKVKLLRIIKTIAISLPMLFLIYSCGNVQDDYSGIEDNIQYKALYKDSYDVRITEIDIDGDGNNELACSDGDYHAAGVSLFKKVKNGSFQYIGTFGSFGRIYVAEEQSLIHSEYGNHGAYYETYSKIDADGTNLVGAVYTVPRMDGTTYYYAHINAPGMNGDANFDYLLFEIPDEFKVSESEYANCMKEYESMAESGWTEISYENMRSVSEYTGDIE